MHPATPAATQGRLFALLAAFFFSWSAPLTRVYEDAGGGAMALLMLRLLLAVPIFCGAAILWRQARPSTRNVILALGLGVFQFGYNSALLLGFANSPASLIVLLLYIYPIIVVIGAALLFNEPVGLRRIVLIAIGMTGLVLVVGTPGTVTAEGLGYGLAAGIGNALAILGIRYMLGRGLEVPQVLGLSYVLPLIATLALFAGGAIALPPSNTDGLLSAIGFATLGSIVPIALFYGAVARIGAGTTSLIATLEPPLTLLWAYALLGESLTVVQLVGASLIIVAVALLSTQEARPAPALTPTTS